MSSALQYACLQDAEAEPRTLYLLADVTVGREEHSAVRFTDPRVSAAHARIRYLGDAGWVIRDLGSKNGTKVGDIQIPPGRDFPLVDGAKLQFGGHRSAWTFRNGVPAELVVRRLDDNSGGRDQVPSEGLLALPSTSEPHAVLFRQADDWVLERAGVELSTLTDFATFEVEQDKFRVRICQSESTLTNRDVLPSISEADLELAVTPDEEHVTATVTISGRATVIPSRSRLYLLVVLARVLVADNASGSDSDEAGWCHVDDVLKEMALNTPEALNVHVFRIRRDFNLIGFRDSAAVIQRRPMSRRIRLGLAADRVNVGQLF